MALLPPRRLLGLLLALFFVIMQSAALTHAALHGFSEHKHAGKICEVHEYCEHLVLADAPVVSVVLPLLVLCCVPAVVLASLVRLPVPASAHSRAPPLFA